MKSKKAKVKNWEAKQERKEGRKVEGKKRG